MLGSYKMVSIDQVIGRLGYGDGATRMEQGLVTYNLQQAGFGFLDNVLQQRQEAKQ
jgi:hypothetical protein